MAHAPLSEKVVIMMTMLSDYERPEIATGSPDRGPERHPTARWEFRTWLIAILAFVPLVVLALACWLH